MYTLLNSTLFIHLSHEWIKTNIVPWADIYIASTIMFCAVSKAVIVFAINNKIPRWTNNDKQLLRFILR
jgi:hypothetical protein